MAVDADKVVIGGVRIYYANIGEAFPANTVLAGAAWGGNWAELGETTKPLTQTITLKALEIMSDQSMGPIKRVVTDRSVSFESELIEFDASKFALVTGGKKTVVTAAASGTKGVEKVTIGSEPCLDEFAFGFEMAYAISDCADTLWIRGGMPRGAAAKVVKFDYGRKSNTGVPIVFECLADTSKPVGEQFFELRVQTKAL